MISPFNSLLWLLLALPCEPVGAAIRSRALLYDGFFCVSVLAAK